MCHRILSIQPHVLENADVALEFEYRAYNYANFTVPVIYWDSYGGGGKEENTEKAYIMVWITH